MTKSDPIPARLAALKAGSMLELKGQWRDLFDAEPPTLQPPIPNQQARLPHSGTHLWWPEARDGTAAEHPH